MQITQNVLLICNGEAENVAFLKKEAKAAALIICADAGADIALKAGLTPDIVIGDFDSVSDKAKKAFTKSKWLYVERQDNTDLEKALDYLLSEKFKKIIIVCSTGGRLDFTLSNFLSAFNYLRYKEIVFKSEKWSAYPLDKSKRFACEKGARVSIIPLGEIQGLTLRGLKYPLNNATLKATQTAVSNETLSKHFTVNFKKGTALVYVES